jgi:hypothetical protein
MSMMIRKPLVGAFADRLKAAGIHFVFSAALVLAVILFCGLVWYPGVLAWAAGMASLMVLIIAVDLVLGPLLTAFVYKKGKKSLKMDLAVIVAIQLSALAYGIHAVYQARPAYIVFTMDRFEVVAAKDIETDRPEIADTEYASVPVLGPTYIAAKMPSDPGRRSEILFSKVHTGAGLAMMPEHYVPLETELRVNLQNAARVHMLEKHNDPERVSRVLSQHGDRDELLYFPLVARDKDMTVLIDKASGTVIDVVDLRPWS